MPFNYNNCDYSPLVIDNEFDIHDEDLLAEYIGKIILGHYSHVKRIILSLSNNKINISNSDYDLAISRLGKDGKSQKDIEKRDGWVFQIISWLALFVDNKEKKLYCQQPHDAPAQHGIDGVAIILNDDLFIQKIIISEDKCSENQRIVIPKIWEEFEKFEQGIHNNKLVSRISALIENLNDGEVLSTNKNDIYKKTLWQYRVGINRNNTYQTDEKRKDLFKGYDDCVTGDTNRRYAATIYQNDIRNWIEQLCQKIIKFLESQKTTHV